MLLVCLTVSLTIISFLHFDLICMFLLYCKIVTSKKPVEPGTSRTLSENHATRSTGHS